MQEIQRQKEELREQEKLEEIKTLEYLKAKEVKLWSHIHAWAFAYVFIHTQELSPTQFILYEVFYIIIIHGFYLSRFAVIRNEPNCIRI